MDCREFEEYLTLDLYGDLPPEQRAPTRRTLPAAPIARLRASKSAACMRFWLNGHALNLLPIFWWSAGKPCQKRSRGSDWDGTA